MSTYTPSRDLTTSDLRRALCQVICEHVFGADSKVKARLERELTQCGFEHRDDQALADMAADFGVSAERVMALASRYSMFRYPLTAAGPLAGFRATL